MLERVASYIWGTGLLVLLLGTGLYLSFRLRFFQFWGWKTILRRTFGSLRTKSGKGGTSLTQFQTFSTALAAAMGTGNILGVAAALCLGGAGAIFWMWVSALLGMANSIFPSDNQRIEMRKAHLLEARASLMALDVRLTHVYLILNQNPEGAFTTSKGNPVKSQDAMEKLDKMAQNLGELIDKENELLKGAIKNVTAKQK